MHLILDFLDTLRPRILKELAQVMLDLFNVLLDGLEQLLLLFETCCSTGLCYGALGDLLSTFAHPSIMLAIRVDLLLLRNFFCGGCLLGSSFTLFIHCKVVLYLSCELVHELVLYFFDIGHLLRNINCVLCSVFFRDNISIIIVCDYSCCHCRDYGRLVQPV